MSKWVTLPKLCQDTGYTPNAIRKKIGSGKLIEGVQYIKRDGRIHINPQEFDRWIENGLR